MSVVFKLKIQYKSGIFLKFADPMEKLNHKNNLEWDKEKQKWLKAFPWTFTVTFSAYWFWTSAIFKQNKYADFHGNLKCKCLESK